MNKLIFSGMILLSFLYGTSSAYDTATHELITSKSSAISPNYQKFKNDFGIDGKQKLGEGSIREDDNLRYLNHFYDPVNNLGLNYSGLQSTLSKMWGFNGGSSLMTNDYSWIKAREYEYIGFTGKDFAGTTVASAQTERNNYFQKMFRSVGQVMHLVQDLGQPSHTRNDPHASAADSSILNLALNSAHIESWAKMNGDKIAGYSSLISCRQ